MKKIYNTIILAGLVTILFSCADKPLDTSDNVTLDDIPDSISLTFEGDEEPFMNIKFGSDEIEDSIPGYGVVDLGESQASCIGCSHISYRGGTNYYIEVEDTVEYIKVITSGSEKIYKVY